MQLNELFSISSDDDKSVILMDHFVDCECDEDYIHCTAFIDVIGYNYVICGKCGMTYDDAPNSRLNEILEWLYKHHLNTILGR